MTGFRIYGIVKVQDNSFLTIPVSPKETFCLVQGNKDFKGVYVVKKFTSGLLSVLMVAEIASVPVAVASKEEKASPQLSIETTSDSQATDSTQITTSISPQATALNRQASALGSIMVSSQYSTTQEPQNQEETKKEPVQISPYATTLIQLSTLGSTTISQLVAGSENQVASISDYGTAKGDCGDNITWELVESTGVLTLTGSGAMTNYASGHAPWNTYRSDIQTVVISSGITHIGNYAFNYCDNATSFTIPNSVTTIGNGSFDTCKSVESITLPENIVSMGTNVFYNCLALNSIDIPPKVTSIESNSFYGCKSLTSISIPEGVTEIGQGAFRECSDLKTVTFPNTLKTIGNVAFWYCTSLASVSLPNTMASLGEGAFYGCESLTTFTLPTSINEVASQLLHGCSALTSVSIHENVTSIKDYAFSGCKSLTEVYIPEAVTSIEAGAFYDCASLTSIKLPEATTSIEANTFYGCTKLQSIYIPTSVVSIGYSAFEKCASLASIQLHPGLTSIGSNTFNGCASLTSLEIPTGVTSLGRYAMANCSSLTSMVIPEGVTGFSDGVFQNCYSLGSIQLPESLTYINGTAFMNCTSLTNLILPEGITFIGDSLVRSTSITNIRVPSNVTTILLSAFNKCMDLTYVLLPKTLTQIGSYAFYDCINLTDIYYEGTEEEWNAIAFGEYVFGFTPNVSRPDITRTIHYNNYEGPDLEQYKIDFYVDGKVYDSITTVKGILLSTPRPEEKEFYDFLGWNTEEDGSGETVTAGSVFTGPTRVYAQWEENHQVTGGVVDLGDLVLEENEFVVYVMANRIKDLDGAVVTVGNQTVLTEGGFAKFTLESDDESLELTIEKEDYFTVGSSFVPTGGGVYLYYLESTDVSIAITEVKGEFFSPYCSETYNFLGDVVTFQEHQSEYTYGNGNLTINVNAKSNADLDIVQYIIYSTDGKSRVKVASSEDGTFVFRVDETENSYCRVEDFTSGSISVQVIDELGNRSEVDLSLLVSKALDYPSQIEFLDDQEHGIGGTGDQTFGNLLPAVIAFFTETLSFKTDGFPVSMYYSKEDGLLRFMFNAGPDEDVFLKASAYQKEMSTLSVINELDRDDALSSLLHSAALGEMYDPTSISFLKFLIPGSAGGYVQMPVWGSDKAELAFNAVIGDEFEKNVSFYPPHTTFPVTLGLSLAPSLEARLYYGNTEAKNIINIFDNASWSGLTSSIIPQVVLRPKVGVGVDEASVGVYGTVSSYVYFGLPFEKWTALLDIGIYGEFLWFESEYGLLSTGEFNIYPNENNNTSLSPLNEALSAEEVTTPGISLAKRTYDSQTMLISDSADETTVQGSVYSSTKPQLVVVEGTSYLFWIDDAGETRADNNAAAIFYSTSTDGIKWGNPIQLFPETANSMAQCHFKVSVDGTTIHITWLEGEEVLPEGTDVLETTKALDLYYATFDTNTNACTSPVRVTNNDSYESSYHVSKDGSMLVWMEHDLSNDYDSLFGRETNNSLHYVSTNDLSKPTTILENVDLATMYFGTCSGKNTLAYLQVVEMEDNGAGAYTQLCVYDMDSKVTNILAEGNISGLQFVDDVLYWYLEGNIHSTANGKDVIGLFDADEDFTYYANFLILDDNGKKSVAYSDYSEEDENGKVYHSIFVRELTDGQWSNAFEVFQSNTKVIAPMTGYVQDGTYHISYLDYQDDYTAVKVTHVEPNSSVLVASMLYDWETAQAGQALDIEFCVYNDGGTVVDTVYVYMDDVLLDTFTDCDLGIGEMAIMTSENFIVPTDLSSVTEFKVKVVTSPEQVPVASENILRIGYTDLCLTANQVRLYGNEVVTLSIENQTNFITDATLNVYADDLDGDVIFSKEINSITKGSTVNQLLDLTALETQENKRIDQFYFEIVPTTATEIYDTDNIASTYIGYGREELASHTITFNPNGGTCSTTSVTTETDGTLPSLPTPTRTGYTFNGWYTAESGGTKITTSYVFTENTTVYAQWKTNTSSNGGSSSGSGSAESSSTYPTLNVSDGGTATVTPSPIENGKTGTIKVTPNDGFVLESITITDADNNNITVTKNADGTYKFTQPISKVTIDVVFKLEYDEIFPETLFTDVKTQDWYYSYVKYAVEKEFMSGIGNGRFAPDDATLRGMIVTMLYSMAGKPNVSGTSPFTDVNSSDYFNNPCTWASQQGIVTGVQPTLFAPYIPVNREEICLILYKYAQTQGGITTNSSHTAYFVDNNSINNWAKEAVNWCYANGIVTGHADGSFEPQTSASRAEIATMLTKFDLLLKD